MADDYVPVRLSHLLRHCSVGAIVRGADSLVVVPDIRFWDPQGGDPRRREIRYVDQVRRTLGIRQALCTPPVATERDGTVLGWIPARRFPLWTRCLSCGLLHRRPWERAAAAARDTDEPGGHRAAEDSARATSGKATGGEGARHDECACGGRLEQMPWVLAHEEGYLADPPWHGMAHAGARTEAQRSCRADWTRPYLRLDEREGRRVVACSRCGARGWSSRPSFPARTWQQPWMSEPPAEAPAAPGWLLEINDVRVHAAECRTALVIPPESRIRRGTVVDRLYGSSRNQRKIRSARNALARRSALRRLAGEYGCTPRDVEQALEQIEKGYPLFHRELVAGDLMAGEYRALIEEIPDLQEDEDFVTEHWTREWKALDVEASAGPARGVHRTVSRLIAVDRLKEILVLMGFRRTGAEGARVAPDVTGESGWLPAAELYGEGIFFTLDEEWLRRWEDHPALRARAESLAERYRRRRAPVDDVDVSLRFLLCHTLAHVVIRQLDAEAGYPAAALKERVYCRSGANAMAGILIYVAVADEEGSLGGLVQLARPRRFLRLLAGAFEAADWCSLDPVCAGQEGHGPDLLNRAACHACALLPETSCAYGNVLLDRTFLTGDGAAAPAFLDGGDPPG